MGLRSILSDKAVGARLVRGRGEVCDDIASACLEVGSALRADLG